MSRRWSRTLLVLITLAVAGAAVTARWQAFAGGVAGSVAESRAAPCLPGTAVPILPSPHIAWSEAASARYNSDPPTSGPHVALPLAPGIYTTSIPDVLAVHALEHGHVAIRYASDLPARDVRRLESVTKRFAADVVLAPGAGPHPIALTAWGRIDLLTGYDEPRIVRFVQELRGRYDHGWSRADPC